MSFANRLTASWRLGPADNKVVTMIQAKVITAIMINKDKARRLTGEHTTGGLHLWRLD